MKTRNWKAWGKFYYSCILLSGVGGVLWHMCGGHSTTLGVKFLLLPPGSRGWNSDCHTWCLPTLCWLFFNSELHTTCRLRVCLWEAVLIVNWARKTGQHHSLVWKSQLGERASRDLCFSSFLALGCGCGTTNCSEFCLYPSSVINYSLEL